MTTPEGKVQEYLWRRIKETGGEHRKVRWLDRNGAPDTFAWWPGPRMVFIETKAPKKDAPVHQTREHNALRKAGFRVAIVDSGERVDALIEEMTGWSGPD